MKSRKAYVPTIDGLPHRRIRSAPSCIVVDYGCASGAGVTLERVMSARGGTHVLSEHVPDNAMDEPGEIARFYDRCSELMRELLDELAAAPDRPRIFPAIEDALGWPHRRIASVLGGACHLRRMEFDGRRPYHFLEPRA